MNLGQAVALCCYEIARRARPVPALRTPATADAAQRERIVEMLTPILEAGGYLLPNTRGSQLKKVRRWVGRLRLAPADARMMQGMLRQVRWKVEHP
jgi:tRNA/rRNA methyltransferase